MKCLWEKLYYSSVNEFSVIATTLSNISKVCVCVFIGLPLWKLCQARFYNLCILTVENRGTPAMRRLNWIRHFVATARHINVANAFLWSNRIPKSHTILARENVWSRHITRRLVSDVLYEKEANTNTLHAVSVSFRFCQYKMSTFFVFEIKYTVISGFYLAYAT